MLQRHALTLPAGRFSYLESGSGDPVVLLHALGRSAADWTTVMKRLSERWRCIALDQRGHGHSCRPGVYSFERLEADLRAFVDQLELDRFALLAHSMGATAAWIFAQRSPERLDRLIIEDTPPPVGGGAVPAVPEAPPEPVDYDWSARRQLLEQLGSPDEGWWNELANVTAPTLLISGGTDTARHATATRVLPMGELVTIPAGHWVHGTDPDAFVDIVHRFLDRGSAATGSER